MQIWHPVYKENKRSLSCIKIVFCLVFYLIFTCLMIKCAPYFIASPNQHVTVCVSHSLSGSPPPGRVLSLCLSVTTFVCHCDIWHWWTEAENSAQSQMNTPIILVLWRCGSFLIMTMPHLHRWWEHAMQLLYSWFDWAASVFSNSYWYKPQ